MDPRKKLKNTFHMMVEDGLGIGKNARESFEEVTSELTPWKLSKDDLVMSWGRMRFWTKESECYVGLSSHWDNRGKLRLSQSL